MPWAADSIADEQPLRERTAVMRTGGGHREYFRTASRQQHWLAIDVTKQHGSVRNR